MLRDGLVRERIEHPAFRVDGGALDLLLGVAEDEEERDTRRCGGRYGDRIVHSAGGSGQELRRGGIPVDRLLHSASATSGTFGKLGQRARIHDRCRDEVFALFERGASDGASVGRDGHLNGAQPRNGLVERDGRATVGPAGAERDVDAQAELAAFNLRILYVVQHLGREEREVLEILRGIVQHLGIDEGHLRAADAVGLHLLELAEDLRLDHGGAEPPPADHRLRLVRRREESLANGGDARRGTRRRLLGERAGEWEQREGEKAGRERESSHKRVTGEAGRTSELYSGPTTSVNRQTFSNCAI